MSAALIALLWKALPFIAAAVGFLGWGEYKKRQGAAKERAKQAAAEQKARDIADDVQNDIGTMTDEQRREELKKWSKS